MVRLLTLTIGPVFLVGLAYLAARPGSGPSASSLAAPDAQATAVDDNRATRPISPSYRESADSSFVAACQRQRESLMKRLGSRFQSVVHTPFVIAGDLPSAQLEKDYRTTIAPTARALAIAYFDRPPTEPITIILFSGDESYQQCVYKLDGRSRVAFAGYYERRERRIIVNTATGEGTIAHELTHALAHFDFPSMPEWFDEGLASLHEEGRFSEDHMRIMGMKNWRGRLLLMAVQQGTLRPLESLIADARMRPDQQAIDYAHARYFCLFLQQRGLLEPFYRKLRLSAAEDPTGLRTLHALFRMNDLAAIDQEFRSWVLAVEHPTAQASAKR